MAKRFSVLRIPFLAALLALFFTACDDSTPLDVPGNTAPVITLDTNVSTFLNKLGETVNVDLKLSDNEGLKLLRVVRKHIDNKGVVITENEVYSDQAVTGTSLTFPFAYTIPASYTIYDKIRFTFYVLDNEGQWDSTFALINVIPESVGPGVDYPLQSYTDNKLMRNGKVFTFPANTQSVFGFAPRNYPTNTADQDIADQVPGTFGMPFEPILISPNNGTRDSIFVLTDSTVFNYDACTYEIIWQAYKAAENPVKITPKLKTGDIVIVKLKPANLPHPMFAVMRIKQIVTNPSTDPRGDYFMFDYKYSFKP